VVAEWNSSLQQRNRKKRTYQLFVDNRSGKYYNIPLDCSTVGDRKCLEAKLVKGKVDFMTKIQFNAVYMMRWQNAKKLSIYIHLTL
jgi:hypothetical protein